MVLRGEAGIGKTALLRYSARQALGCRISQISGVAAELEMPFAALHQLCAPMLEHLDALPTPQQQAMQVAFGMAPGNAPDQFAVGLAVLGLLADAAADRPLVCLVDDAQWLDEATRQVLGVAARRLLAESVMLLLAVRETGEERLFAGLPDLTVAGLRRLHGEGDYQSKEVGVALERADVIRDDQSKVLDGCSRPPVVVGHVGEEPLDTALHHGQEHAVLGAVVVVDGAQRYAGLLHESVDRRRLESLGGHHPLGGVEHELARFHSSSAVSAS